MSEFSEVVNLSMIDQFRKEFYVFGRLYDEISETNVANNVGLRDISGQNLRDVVFLN
jgi:hypothetical protein